GAVPLVRLESWVSLLSNPWLVCVGVLFILMVTFAPGGLAGIILMPEPIWRSGRLGRLAGPYARILAPGAVAVAGFVLLIELCSFLTVGAAQGKSFKLSGLNIDPQHPGPWLVGAALLAAGGPGPCGAGPHVP